MPVTDLNLHIGSVDTLMFRDGRPFNQADFGASEAVSVFPPYPPTVVGAVRAALWQGPLGGDWKPSRLGTGTNWQDIGTTTLGPLKFGAPVLLCDGEPVFPVPLHIVEGRKSGGVKKELTCLVPGLPRQCDRGTIRLPVPEDATLEGVAPVGDRWVTTKGMQQILDGGVPEDGDLISQDRLWHSEPRVGIGITAATRTTSDGRLYMASHVRMQDDVSLHVRLSGWNDSFEAALLPLAGEHRMAALGDGNAVPLPEVPDKGRRCLIALSPVVPDPKDDFLIAGLLDNDIESACLGRSVPIGGWDSLANGPIPLRRCYPAGSVWFLKPGVKAPDEIGLATEWGFGQVMAGNWRERQQR